MSKIANYLLLCMLLLASASCSASRQMQTPDTVTTQALSGTTLSKSEAKNVAAFVSDKYTPWQRVSIRGKVKLDGIPISLTMKLYMVKDQSVILSMSAPLLGEVARMEVDGDSVLLVNKKGKCYYKAGIADRLAQVGATVTDLQDVFLSRVFLVGSGTLSKGNADKFAITTEDDGGWRFAPKQGNSQAEYYFLVNQSGRIVKSLVQTLDERYGLIADYTYSGSDTELDMKVKYKAGKSMNLNVILQEADFSPKPIDPIEINSHWSRVPFKKLLSGF